MGDGSRANLGGDVGAGTGDRVVIAQVVGELPGEIIVVEVLQEAPLHTVVEKGLPEQVVVVAPLKLQFC